MIKLEKKIKNVKMIFNLIIFNIFFKDIFFAKQILLNIKKT